MPFWTLARRPQNISIRISKMTAQLSNGTAQDRLHGPAETADHGAFTGVPLKDLLKSNTFTASLPPDPEFKTPVDSFKAPRQKLGPRMVKGALYTFVRPEETEDPELLGVSHNAMRDIGLKKDEEKTQQFKLLVAGNKIDWDHETEKGIYPWAQCYGGTLHRKRFIVRKKLISLPRLAIVCRAQY